MPTETPASFALADRAGWTRFLAEHGYAVVSGAISREAAASALQDLWGLMEALSPVRRDRPATWRTGTSWPPMLHGGMIQYLGHTALQWRLREQTAPLFASYYEVAATELATSFDGLCMMHGARGYKNVGNLVSFLHTDQSPLRRGEWSIQGLVNLAESGHDDGGLVVVPGSHLEHQAFFEGHPKGTQKDDWYKLTDAETARYASRTRKVCAQPGDFLLWDSRTLHCNTVPGRKDAIRACVYVCMLPKERVLPHVRVKRAMGWRERRVSCHHPGDGFRLFPTLPRFVTGRDAFYAKVLALQQGFELTPLQQSLVCGQP
jgi:ectoine hydroxylase-related dioxygenase (phytanoyl-CoA dioxygenase family)